MGRKFAGVSAPFALLFAVGLIAGGSPSRAQVRQGNAVAPPAGRDSRATSAGTAAIAGVVVAADTGRPVRRVRVTLSSTAPDVSLAATTADDGHFKFSDLPAGAFTLAASRPGFIDSVFGQRTLTIAATAPTDDRGCYRATGLLPGDYLVSATSADGPSSDQAADAKKRLAEVSTMGSAASPGALSELKATIASLVEASDPSKDTPAGYAPVYDPGTTLAAAAQTVTLGVSEERQAVDVSLQLVPLTRIVGVVAGAAGTAGSVLVVLTATGTPVPLPGPRTTLLDQDGHFSFSAVSPGSYTIMAFTMQDSAVTAKLAADKLAAAFAKSQPDPDIPSAWASADVVVDGRPMPPLVLALQAALAVSGRFALSGSSRPPDFSRMRVLLSAASSASPERSVPVPSAAADMTGRFSVAGLVPGRYRLSVAGAAGPWSIASAVIGGRYGFYGLPPGDYRVAVVPDVEPGQWYDPNWLRQVLPSAMSITLAEGERRLQDLRVGK